MLLENGFVWFFTFCKTRREILDILYHTNVSKSKRLVFPLIPAAQQNHSAVIVIVFTGFENTKTQILRQTEIEIGAKD